MQVNVEITNREFRNVLKNKIVILDFFLKKALVQGNYYRRTRHASRSTCTTRQISRSTCLATLSNRSTRLSTRSTRLSIRLSTRGICLSTRSTCLSTRSTRSTICRSFYN